jgi:hypothetical protein
VPFNNYQFGTDYKSAPALNDLYLFSSYFLNTLPLFDPSLKTCNQRIASSSDAQLPEEKSGQVCWKSDQYRQVGMCHL